MKVAVNLGLGFAIGYSLGRLVIYLVESLV